MNRSPASAMRLPRGGMELLSSRSALCALLAGAGLAAPVVFAVAAGHRRSDPESARHHPHPFHHRASRR